MDDEDAAALLRGAHLRVTRPRVAVLDVLASHPHADVDTIVGAVRDRLGSVSKQAVYDVMKALDDAGLVRRIEPAHSPARYEARVGDNHHHLVCSSCGVIVDIDCAVGSAPCLQPAGDTGGFVVDRAEVTYWGLCADCADGPARVPDPTTNPDGGTTP